MPAAPEIDAGRTTVGPFLESEADMLSALGNDASIAAMLTSLPHPFTPAMARERIARFAYRGRPGYRLAVRRANGELVSEIGLGPEAEPSVMAWIGRDHRRLGHAKRALLAFCRDAFGRFDVAALTAEVRSDNLPSRRLLEGLGFRQIATQDASAVIRFRLPWSDTQ